MNTRTLLASLSAGTLLSLSLSFSCVHALAADPAPATAPAQPAAKPRAESSVAAEVAELDALKAELQKLKPGTEKSTKTAEFLTRVKDLADGYIKDLKFDEAAKVLAPASAIASSSKTGLAEEVAALIREVPKKRGAATRVNQLIAKFDKSKPDAKNARIIVELFAFDLQMPEKAQEYADFTGDKTLAGKLKLAATPLESQDAAQLVELGDFYAASAKASLPHKTALSELSRKAYLLALEKGIKDEKVKRRVEAASLSEKDKAAAPTTPVGELNVQIVQFYQSLPKEYQIEGAFSDEQKKNIAPQVKAKIEGRVVTVGGVITAISSVPVAGSKEKVTATVTLDLADITDRTVTASVAIAMTKADENSIAVGGHMLVKARVAAATLANATNTIKMTGGTVVTYKPDPGAGSAPAPRKK